MHSASHRRVCKAPRLPPPRVGRARLKEPMQTGDSNQPTRPSPASQRVDVLGKRLPTLEKSLASLSCTCFESNDFLNGKFFRKEKKMVHEPITQMTPTVFFNKRKHETLKMSQEVIK